MDLIIDIKFIIVKDRIFISDFFSNLTEGDKQLSLFIANNCVYSQNAGTTTCGTYYACPYTYIKIPISISGSPLLSALSLDMEYDPAVLSFVNNGTGVVNKNQGFINANWSFFSNHQHIFPNLETCRIGAWGGNATVQNNGTGKMFDLVFKYKGGTTTIHFNNSSDSGGDCEYTDTTTNALYDNNGSSYPYYIDGYVGPTSISGNFYYDNGTGTSSPTPIPLDSLHVILLKSPYSFPTDTVRTGWTDINGHYSLLSIDQTSCIKNNDYKIIPTTITWGGVNSTDATKVQQNYLYTWPVPPGPAPTPSTPYNQKMRWNAADVDYDFIITPTDKQDILDRWAGNITSFPRGDWFFERNCTNTSVSSVPSSYDNMVTYSGTNLTNIDFWGLCVGDVNLSYNPGQGQKSQTSGKVGLTTDSIHKMKETEYFELPIKVSENISVSAISLVLKFPKNLVQISDVKLKHITNGSSPQEEEIVYNINETGLRIGWVARNVALNFNANDEILVIKLTTKSCFNNGDIINFVMDKEPLCELADEYGNPITKTELKITSIEYDNSKRAINVNNLKENFDNFMQISPNPAKEVLNIEYKTSDKGKVNIVIYNVFGEKVKEVFSELQQKGSYNFNLNTENMPVGVYYCKMIINNNFSKIKKFIVEK